VASPLLYAVYNYISTGLLHGKLVWIVKDLSFYLLWHYAWCSLQKTKLKCRYCSARPKPYICALIEIYFLKALDSLDNLSQNFDLKIWRACVYLGCTLWGLLLMVTVILLRLMVPLHWNYEISSMPLYFSNSVKTAEELNVAAKTDDESVS